MPGRGSAAASPATRLRVPARGSSGSQLDLVVPALGDRLAGQVDDGVAAGQRRCGRGPGQRIPALGSNAERCAAFSGLRERTVPRRRGP